MDREKKGNVLGFQSWLQFYSKTTASKKKNKTYEEFIKSAYFIPFVKFGNYCVDVRAINVSRYVDWLLKFNVRIDDWTSDTVYNRYLTDYLKTEDPYDAVRRGIEYCMDLADKERIQPQDCLKFVHPNKVCMAVANGKISPWILYQSKSGIEFMEKLNPDQVKIVFDYIDPEFWALKFKRDPDTTNKIKDLLKEAGY